jgi:hypothetical protein
MTILSNSAAKSRAGSIRGVAVAALVLVGLLAAGALWAVSLFTGLYTMEIEGRRVRRQTRWYFHQIGVIPYPFARMVVCYAYRDQQQHKVFHGPCDVFDEEGNRTVSRHYTDGKLTGPETLFDEGGLPKLVTYWRDDRKVGEAVYRGGELYSSREIISDEHGEATMEKFFYNGRWSLRFKCGTPSDREIDEQSGQIRRLPQALPPASDCLKEVKLDY